MLRKSFCLLLLVIATNHLYPMGSLTTQVATASHKIIPVSKAAIVTTATFAGIFAGVFLETPPTLLAHEYGHSLASWLLLRQRTRVLWSWRSLNAITIDVENEKDEKISFEECMKESDESASKNANLTKEEVFAQAKEQHRSYIEKLNTKMQSKNCDIKDAVISVAGPLAGIASAVAIHKALSVILHGKLNRLSGAITGVVSLMHVCNLFPVVYKDGETSDGAKVALDLEKRCGYDAKKYVFCGYDF